MTKHGRARRESDLPRSHPHPDADRPTARIPFAQLRSLVLSIIEPPESPDDLILEFETQPTTFRARLPPAHYLGTSSDQIVADHEIPDPGRVGTLDALVAELRIANARIMARKPDDGPVAAIAMPPTSARGTTAPPVRAQDSRADKLTPPLPMDAPGSRADIMMPLPSAARSNRLDSPALSALSSRSSQPGMTVPPSIAPVRRSSPSTAPPFAASDSSRASHPAVTPGAPPSRPGQRPITAPSPLAPRHRSSTTAPPVTPGSRPRQPAMTTPPTGTRGSRPVPTAPPRPAQGSRADQLMAPPRRAPATRGEHPIVTAPPRRSQTSHTDPQQGAPRRAQTSSPRRAPTNPQEPSSTTSPRRAQSRADRSGVTPPPRRARTINEVNHDRPASGRR